MTLEKAQNIILAMRSRAGQWRTRVGIGVILVLAYSPLVGLKFSALWFAAYIAVQAVEGVLRPDGPQAARLGPVRYGWVSLALVFVSNLIFGAFGAWELIVIDSPLSLLCGALLVGGAVLNGILISGASRPLAAAAIIPLGLYLTLLPIGAARLGFSVVEVMQLTLAACLLILSAVAAGRRLSKSNEEREAARLAAEEANRAKSDFLATMSHEIRTPLNGVLGMAQAMAVDDLSGRQRERLEVISRSGESLLAILGDVLDLAKIEAGKLDIEDAPFDLGDVVDRAQATFRAIAQSKGLTFESDVAPEAEGRWLGDAARLRQVLCNLISNAVKFTDRGCVRVTGQVEDGRLVLVVADTGPGMTEEQRARLFERFVQADASTTRKFGGTGLGLAISARLVEMMGGTLTAEPVQPHGLSFRVDLPLTRCAAAQRVDMVAVDTAVADGDRALRVLAAEDHAINRQVLTLLLSQAGILPHIVENGREAVEAWREAEWDLILMDVQMPVMDGPEAARTIRAEEAAAGRAHTPIIALTANVMTHQINAYLEDGMGSVVAKPIQVEALLSAIQKAVTERAPEARQAEALVG